MDQLPLRIHIADDHELVRKGLRHFLESTIRCNLTESGSGDEAVRMIREVAPAIAVLDVQMPGKTGLEVAAICRQENLPVHIILLTMFRDELAFNKALDLGVRGYILKENTVAEIQDCISAVLGGGEWVSPTLQTFLENRQNRQCNPSAVKPTLEALTTTELRVLKLLATMKTNQEIAEEMNISIKTVHNHRNNICTKLELRGAHALLRFAIENNTGL